MKRSDIFIIADDVQYERQGFQNRNKIKINDREHWLTVPIRHIGKNMLINQVKIANEADPKWGKRHWLTIKQYYSKAPYWDGYCLFFKKTYEKEWHLLLDINMHIIKEMMNILDIHTELIMSSSLFIEGNSTELIINMCKKCGTNKYLSGIGGKNYLNLQRFKEENIKIYFHEFNYPVYNQQNINFIPNLSVIDYIFNADGKKWFIE